MKTKLLISALSIFSCAASTNEVQMSELNPGVIELDKPILPRAVAALEKISA